MKKPIPYGSGDEFADDRSDDGEQAPFLPFEMDFGSFILTRPDLGQAVALQE